MGVITPVQMHFLCRSLQFMYHSPVIVLKGITAFYIPAEKYHRWLMVSQRKYTTFGDFIRKPLAPQAEPQLVKVYILLN